MVLALYKLHERYKIKEIVVSTYQSVSGAGYKGINELLEQEKGSKESQVFPKQILHNVIPLIGNIEENGFTTEEMKMVNETRKILNDPSIIVFPTTVRVPVLYGHSESVLVRLEKEYENLDIIKQTIASGENVKVVDEIITPIDVEDSDITFVCRVRAFDNRSVMFWNVADNIRVGAATNAVRILVKHMTLNGVN
jgi:aspartate-semialdehyde dehydrogenase